MRMDCKLVHSLRASFVVDECRLFSGAVIAQRIRDAANRIKKIRSCVSNHMNGGADPHGNHSLSHGPGGRLCSVLIKWFGMKALL
jgi:hypothetical protein